MSDSTPALRSEQEPLADSDYDTILGAVMETARGRWFLQEYARQNRNADTGVLLVAIDRIESLLKSREAAPEAADAPASVPGILMQLRDIAENLIECGAPAYLCNDLLRRIEELALTYAKPGEMPMPVASLPAVAIPVASPIASPIASPVTSHVEIAAAEPQRDPYADILALSPEERIALFT
jgi:hypothetical protein